MHYGLWDYDFPTHPNLVDVVVDGRPIEGGTQGTLMRPPDFGAAGWAVDPETGMLYVPSRNIAVAIPLDEPDAALGSTMRYTHGAPEATR